MIYSRCVKGGMVNEGERGALIYLYTLSERKCVLASSEAPWLAPFVGGTISTVRVRSPCQVQRRVGRGGLVQIMHRSNAARNGCICCLFWKHTPYDPSV